MKSKSFAVALLVAGTLGIGGYALYTLGLRNGMHAAMSTTDAQAAPAAGPPSVAEGEDATRRHVSAGLKAGDIDPVSGRKILYYQDPMVPGNKFDKPGRSPFMDMMLVPVYADGDSDQSKVTVSARIQQNLGVRTALVTQGTLAPQVSAVGSVTFNERDQAIVQARATGYVERLHVRATLDPVAKGQPLVELYIPDWIAAQEEFLSVGRMQGSDLAVLVDAARQRMRQVGMTDEQVRLVERTGRTQARITLTAPIAGVLVELTAREGMTVAAGATLFRINGLSTVWANAEIPESQAALVRPGATVQAKSPAAPGVTFEGKVQAIVPDVNPSTRTLKARLELANPGSRLVPGMFISMQFADQRAEKALLIPTEAVIQTGKRTVVMLAEDNGHFRPVDIEAGIETDGRTEIKRGLLLDQRVVVSSQFLIDSEASLRGIEARLNGESPQSSVNDSSAVAMGPRHVGKATIESIGKEEMTLSHGPITTLKWGPMTMDFKLPAAGAPGNVRVGDHVDFEFVMGPDNLPQLTIVTPTAAKAATSGKKP